MAEPLRLPTRSTGLKFLLVCLLALVMSAPIVFVWGVLQDRLNRYNTVRTELAGYEGGEQRILGPVMLVPYSKEVRQDDKIVTVRGEAVAFAEAGDADAKLEMDVRARGIYTVPVYRAQTRIKAMFDPGAAAAALAALDPGARYDFANARLAMGVSNSKGIMENVALDLPGAEGRIFKPMLSAAPIGEATYYDPSVGAGFMMIAAPVGDLIQPRAPLEISATVNLSGAQRFAVAAFAKDTTANVAGDWPDPSFEGGFLPTTRKVTGEAFTAAWSAPLARRGIPEAADTASVLMNVAQTDFAVRFVEPTNVYTGVDRALKYSLMFIGLVFLAYFMFEIVSGLKAHPAQYIMVGLSQAIFYLLLLAFAERLGFTVAFLIAAGLTVTLISAYVVTVFKARKYLVPAATSFVGLYALMFVLMQLEDYALVVGAATSFVALAALMYLTRNVDWYAKSEARDAG